jgi:hypothetical protein
MAENLWPNFNLDGIPNSPKGLIDRVGEGLREKTNGLLLFHAQNTAVEGTKITASYTIYSIPLRYHYPFMRATMAIPSGYPVSLVADKLEPLVVNNEPELIAALARIFASPSTIDTVQQLLVLSK